MSGSERCPVYGRSGVPQGWRTLHPPQELKRETPIMSNRPNVGHSIVWKALFGALLVSIGLLGAPAAQAQAAAVSDFEIPAQSLETALRKVAETQNLQIIFTPSDVKGIMTRAGKWKLTAVEAIEKLIEGTGLIAVYDGQNAVAIKPAVSNSRGGQAGNPTLLAPAQSETNRA